MDENRAPHHHGYVERTGWNQTEPPSVFSFRFHAQPENQAARIDVRRVAAAMNVVRLDRKNSRARRTLISSPATLARN